MNSHVKVNEKFPFSINSWPVLFNIKPSSVQSLIVDDGDMTRKWAMSRMEHGLSGHVSIVYDIREWMLQCNEMQSFHIEISNWNAGEDMLPISMIKRVFVFLGLFFFVCVCVEGEIFDILKFRGRGGGISI